MHRAYMHHVYMHQSQGLSMLPTPSIALLVGWLVGWLVRDKICRIMDICITHTCSIVKYQGSWMYASYINTSCTCIMIKEHMCMHHAYMHHVYMHQSQGLSMHDKYAAS